MVQINLFTKQIQTHRLRNKLMIAMGARWGEGIVREFEINMYALLCLKWIINKDVLYSKGNAAQCYVAAWTGGEFRGEWTHVCRAESLCSLPETVTTLLICCIKKC